VTIADHLDNIWHGLLEFMSQFVIPDWGSLVNLLPVFLMLGVVGPLLSLLLLVWFIYLVRRPRTKVEFEEGSYAAPLDTDGRPVYPVAEPYCPRDGLVFPTGVSRCDVCRDDLSIVCPKCGVGRRAAITTCGNCGLVLKVIPRARALRPAGPPPGGAAVA
jgi:hypothetical protein